MKRIALILGCCCIVLISCEKKYLIPEKALPQWLKINIDKDLEIISKNPKSWKALGSWIRTEWNDEYYYEYYNGLLSSLQNPISHYQDTLRMDPGMAITNYYNEKCCEVFVWKGPGVK